MKTIYNFSNLSNHYFAKCHNCNASVAIVTVKNGGRKHVTDYADGFFTTHVCGESKRPNFCSVSITMPVA